MRLDIDDKSRYFDIHRVRLDHRDKHGDLLLLLRDITEQTLAHETLRNNQAELEALNDELARLSITDTLTGLRNRRYFLEQLGQECERAARHFQSFALLSIDLDDFKLINDTHGHAAGDDALVCAARAMESQCRKLDTLARVGGEEFMVLLLNVRAGDLEAVAERFRGAIERTPVPLNDDEYLNLTASIGGALITPHIDMRSALIQADDALYAAKRAGRNRVVLSCPDGTDQGIAPSRAT